MKRYKLAVCKGPDCSDGGAQEVYEKACKVKGSNCTVSRGGCYGLCHLGPNVVVREDTGARKDPFSKEDFQLMGTPNETYYWHMTPETIVRVIELHVGKDQVQTDLVGDPAREEDFVNNG